MIEALLAEVWCALIANRLRTFLTMLGMVIGVGAVVLMVAIGDGVQDSVNRMISSMGSNLLMVLSGSSSSGGVRMGTGAMPTLTQGDANSIMELPEVTAVSPLVYGIAQVVYGSNNWSTMIAGVTPSYFTITNWLIENGGAFTNPDFRSATRVAVIGKTVAKNIFGDEDAVGKTIRIRNNPFVIIGLLSAKGQTLDGRDSDDNVFVPVTTAQRKLFGTRFRDAVRLIIVQASSVEALTELLHERHHIAKNAEDDFNVQNLTALAAMAVSTAGLLSLMLGAIASISLLVGGSAS